MKTPKYKVFDTSHRLFILMRNDLPSMNPGRAMAQAAHASNQFIYKHGKDHRVKKWQNDIGFGTTICLSATEHIIREVVKVARSKGHLTGAVFDPTYSFVLHQELAVLIDPKVFTAEPILKDDGRSVLFRNELTCGYLFLHEEHPDREMLVGDLLLHP